MKKARSEIRHSSNNLRTLKNPHNICTLNENSACASCGIQGKLACKWDQNILSGFYAIAVPAVIMAYLGIVYSSFITGAWWPLIIYIVYFLVMFNDSSEKTQR